MIFLDKFSKQVMSSFILNRLLSLRFLSNINKAPHLSPVIILLFNTFKPQSDGPKSSSIFFDWSEILSDLIFLLDDSYEQYKENRNNLLHK